jgi:hypothetical protein
VLFPYELLGAVIMIRELSPAKGPDPVEIRHSETAADVAIVMSFEFAAVEAGLGLRPISI